MVKNHSDGVMVRFVGLIPMRHGFDPPGSQQLLFDLKYTQRMGYFHVVVPHWSTFPSPVRSFHVSNVNWHSYAHVTI
jgi:hypothetical protein